MGGASGAFWYRHIGGRCCKHMAVRWAIQGILIEHRRMSTDREVIQKREMSLTIWERIEGHMSTVAEKVRRRGCRVIGHPRQEFNCGTESAVTP
jgi:hypothetical protein